MYQMQEINTTLEEEIAERQAVQEALHKSRDELAATNSELKSFASIVAHDFRAPMVNLKGFSKELGYSLNELQQIIKDNVSYLPEKIQKQVDILIDKEVPEELSFIYSSVDRLSRMIDVLLQLSRIGRRVLTYKEIDISSLVTAVLHSYNNLIEKNDIQVAMGSVLQIETDQVAMEQIIGNLVDNAIKYLEPDDEAKSLFLGRSKAITIFLVCEITDEALQRLTRKRYLKSFGGRENKTPPEKAWAWLTSEPLL